MTPVSHPGQSVEACLFPCKDTSTLSVSAGSLAFTKAYLCLPHTPMSTVGSILFLFCL